jgi:hypothetical protein
MRVQFVEAPGPNCITGVNRTLYPAAMAAYPIAIDTWVLPLSSGKDTLAFSPGCRLLSGFSMQALVSELWAQENRLDRHLRVCLPSQNCSFTTRVVT